MYLRTTFAFCSILIALFSLQTYATPLPGVPLSLATERKALLSDIRYQLRFFIPRTKELPVKAFAMISFRTKDRSKEVVLDFTGSDDAVKSISVNGKKEPVRYSNEHIIISPELLKKGTNKIKIVFEPGNNALNRNNDYMYTLFVPERARTAFPCFDQPDLKAVFDLRLIVPAGWSAMSNGEMEKAILRGSDKECRFKASEQISTYLFAFAAGRFKKEKRKVDGREMEFLYRETDTAKLQASMSAIFDIHAQSLRFMEKYTGIPYPFSKFSFAAIPDFQFGGMEHPGAIWYNANSLFLDSSATRTQLIRRATLIAHETSHMWFGDLVTMQWFNDVWMKEVFANFMADKIVSEILPDDNAQLKFITEHFPAAYSVDRTKGANPIRQPLDNLDEAGSLYGNIIYHKAPIMMQQLERLTGEQGLQDGLKIYLKKYAFNNAAWPDLISILDTKTKEDLQAWNDSWVNKPGRPVIHGVLTDVQQNTYGLFELDTTKLMQIPSINNTEWRVFSWINLYENVIEGRYIRPLQWITIALDGLQQEKEELISQLLLNQLQTIYWVYITPEQRSALSRTLERELRALMDVAVQPNLKKLFFKAWVDISLSSDSREMIYQVWKNKVPPPGVKLSDEDYTALAAELAIKQHPLSETILKEELSRISNPDKKMRWEFLLPALSGDEKTRDAFFESLKELSNRRKEAWVNTALTYLHHPLRERQSVKYIRPSLEMLQEIQRTGDIFFPANWLQATLGLHQSVEAEKAVNDFIRSHPGYNPRLMNKLLQAADPLFRARKILSN